MTVLVGYQHSEEGLAALWRGVEEARVRAAPLHVLRVLAVPASDDPTQHRDWARSVEHARQDARRLEEELRAEGVEARAEVASPNAEAPADTLLEACRGRGVTLLVIGLRRRSRVGKLLLGSTAQRLLLEAPVPVLAVKAPESAD